MARWSLVVQSGRATPGRPTCRTRSARVGVSDGESIPGYLAASRERLDQLAATAPDQPVYALVSFTGYLTPDQVAALVRMAVATTGADTSGQLTTVYARPGCRSPAGRPRS